ncbi:PREDICTED: DET1- and DDB1-associated protein 1-like [Diuraphis noxia]|uniref:DET1- and DDB1-associated protein 1-like n=1 Tax=Diuraphis noxia TaxID=143948 RepID=UPI00076378D2|nr:PREDICTED: DET1- and DDB1-associated protein 1-like [Diuraphis noxia]XP_015377828.1 PREDICTED: DET1- and DDB1-associated protein 1-like [Diuraphis noxia]XP_015377829.1 PREDICTED: DET1- and DDB1-associated protein 1-like [Diuraphis noxia]
MSIAEFLDGLPSIDKRNFSRFIPKNDFNKPAAVYITTNDQSPSQIIVNDNSHLSLQYLHKRWDKKHGCKKRALEATSEESGSTSKKCPRV